MPRLLLRTLCLLAAASLPAAAQGGHAHGHGADPTFGVHGMLVFGDSAIYLSHLPLYRAPHDWQIVLRATVTSDGETSVPDALAALRADRASTGERVYTLEPERFSLARLREEAREGTFRFRGTLYRGHFERGGTPIVTGAVFEATLVHLRQVVNVPPPPGAAMEESWLYLGSPGDEYLVHRVEGAPDFDQVVRVERIGAAPEGFAPRPATVGLRPGPRGAPLREGHEAGMYDAENSLDWIRGRYRVARVIFVDHDDLARP